MLPPHWSRTDVEIELNSYRFDAHVARRAFQFPEGLPAFQKELGLPLIAHNRWYDANSPYCQRYECAPGEGNRNAALPIAPEFWDEIMELAAHPLARDYARHQGVPPRRLPGQRGGYARLNSPGSWDVTM